ncbi:uncharacterized protein LOC131659227 [Vicia villosa]|uniref:uncharacterized protein LOC131659227 n=1 Tax=Vicia villosa TaxID=3911 RepID=UPI00273BB778|nr:uncharacterized protein LOC131659227 [Vicia villosa]
MHEFKEAIVQWSVLNGREIKFVKNDKVKVRVVCKGNCGFLALVSKVGNKHTYRMKKWLGPHTCGRVLNNTTANSKWIAKTVASRMTSSDGIKLREIVSDIRNTYYVELRRVNAGNTYKINVIRVGPTMQPKFGCFYFCFDGIKKGFTHVCRPFIGVDGCHLKTKYGGTLLVVVGMDPNDQYYPLAFSVCETETKESWRWFLTLILEDIGQEKRWGLILVFEEMFERVEHRLYLRHLYANFKKKFGSGTQIRDLMMAAAKATYIQAWEAMMKELKVLNHKAWEWLMKVPTKL